MRKTVFYRLQLLLCLLICLSALVACGESPSTSAPAPAASTSTAVAQPTPVAGSNNVKSTVATGSATVTDSTLAPLPPLNGSSGVSVGLNIYLYGQDAKIVTQTINWLKDLKVSWVRLPLYWNEIEPAKGQRHWAAVDQTVNDLRGAGINIMLNVVHCPAWAALTPDKPGLPRNMADFNSFMSEAAQRYKGKVAAYEIWNEPNLAREIGPIQVGGFVALLKTGYTAIKAADPTAVVVSGGLTPTGVNNPKVAVDDVQYLKQFYAYNGGEAKKYYDVLGDHPGSSQNPPDTLWPDKPGPGPGWRDDPSFYFRRIEQIRQVMVDNGESAKKIWLTEFGWASTPHPADGFGFAAQVSEDQQGQYIAGALAKAQRDYPWVGRMFIFQLNMALPQFTPDPTDERIAWGLIRRDGSERPSYVAVRNFISSQP